MTDVVPNQSDVQGPYSALVTFSRSTLPAPTSVLAVYEVSSKQLTVSFDLVTGATNYTANVLDANNTVVVTGSNATSPIPPIDAQALTLDTAYTVQVIASNDNTVGTPATIGLTPVALTAPTISKITNLPDAIQVEFSLVTGANSYTAQVLDSAGQPLSPPVTGTGSASPVTVDASTLTAGTSYQVEVRADVINPPGS